MKPSNAAASRAENFASSERIRVAVGDEVQMLSVLRPADPVEGVQAIELHVILQIHAGGGEGLLEHPRHRHERRAGVPRVAGVAQLVGPPARPFARLEDRHVVARALQPHRCAEPAESCADDDDSHLGVPSSAAPARRVSRARTARDAGRRPKPSRRSAAGSGRARRASPAARRRPPAGALRPRA